MPKKTEIKDYAESESSYEESESSNDEQIEIKQEKPQPKKERKVRCDKKRNHQNNHMFSLNRERQIF
jgi:hypothetical protein